MRVSINAPVLKATLVTALAVGQVSAFWRMPCRSRTGVARIDPLVTNGSVAEHVHAIHGSGGKFSLSSSQFLTRVTFLDVLWASRDWSAVN
tara:strand:- start:120 stop:392 length:273 start_codon:yes stop_codon:yes gene_type:complete